MFIKLTRLDGSPIWINAAFVVTVEPRKGGGAVVVPIGDGLDYDVLESPEAVLTRLGDAPAAAVVPVPASDALAPTPADVSPEPEPAPPTKEEKPARKAPRQKAKPPSSKTAAPAKPAARVKAQPKPPVSDLTDDDLERLRRMAPGSVKKLQNTLATQFNVADAEKVMKTLAEHGVLEVGGNRVIWQRPDA
ncbi:MAG: hypothetical protein IJI35_00440 [Kiritimatiellae bacterium]|nr:hypothetical protein [Kiritimatiellia bacterium]